MIPSPSRRAALPGAILALAALPALVACSQPARESRMTVGEGVAPLAQPGTRLRDAVEVASVAGGRPTSPLWLSQVDNPEFAHALRNSLRSSAMLAAGEAAPRYLVEAQLLELRQPWFGLDMTVTSRVAWRVRDRASDSLVHEDLVTSAHTVPFAREPLGPERLRQASEGAVRENIRAFLRRLAERGLPAEDAPLALAAPGDGVVLR